MFIEIRNVNKAYNTGKISLDALKNVNLTMNEGNWGNTWSFRFGQIYTT